MKYHYVYQVTLPSTGEFYIGVRTSSVSPSEDSYKGSMSAWKVDKNLLSKEILGVYPTRLKANAAEQIKIKTYIENTLNRNYHIPNVGFCNYGILLSEETKKKMSEVAKGKPKSEEHKNKLSEAAKGRIYSEETKKKLSEVAKGNQSFKEKFHSEESKKKMSESRKGKTRKPFSEETKKKMSEGAKLRWEKILIKS